MKKILLMCLMYSCFCTAFSQNTDKEFIVCGDKSANKFIYAAGGIFFFPASDKENIPNSALKYCDGALKRVYTLNGIKLTEAMFISLNLKARHVANQKGEYSFQYSKDNCIEFISMSVDISLPIILNGTELSMDNRRMILEGVEPTEILLIKRKKALFGRGEIYIRTRH